MRPSILTPSERRAAINELAQERDMLNCSSAWESKYDHDPAQLKHRELLRRLIGALDERIAELSINH